MAVPEYNGENFMFRLTTFMVFCAVCALPAIATADLGGCGCDGPAVVACDSGCGCHTSCCDPCNNCCNDCCKRTRLRLVRTCKEVCRTQRVCTTDCCGCSRLTRVRVKKCVPRLRLARVEVPSRCGLQVKLLLRSLPQLWFAVATRSLTCKSYANHSR